MFPPFLSSALLLYIQCLETSGRLVFICICWEFWKSWDASQVAEGATCPVCHRAPGPLAYGGQAPCWRGLGVPGPSAFPARSFRRVEGLDLEGSLA